MPSRAQKIRLGIFVLAGLLALISLIAFFTTNKYLQKTDTYHIAYQDVSVSGLEIGSPVKYLGIKVGTIKNISISPEDVSRIIVKVALKPGTPVKEDARADIVSIGITGLKMIEIRGGSNAAPLLKEGDYITAGSSSITEEITGKAEVLAEKMERVLNNLQKFTQPENLDKITQMAERASASFEKMDAMISENRRGVQETVRSVTSIAVRLDTTSQLLYESVSRINQIVRSDTVEQILASTRDISRKLKEANLEQLIQELGEVVNRTNRLLLQVDHDLERGSLDFLSSMSQLKTTLENLNQASRMIEEDPSVLIRGTKFKSTPDEQLKRK